MKTFITALLFCIVIISCKKNNIQGQQALTGKWEMRQLTGGIAGTINYEPGTGTKIEFYANNSQYKIEYTANINVAPRSGPYQVKESSHSGDWLLQLQYVVNNQTVTETDSVRFDANKLIFLPASSCCDMPTIFYERLQ